MDAKHWLVYILFILSEAFVVSFLMEMYKKKVRKDNFKVWEVRLLGLLLSAACVMLLHFSDLIYPLFRSMFGSDLWLDYLIYLVLFYFLQMNVDLRILKGVIKSLVLQWLRSTTGLSEDTLEEILDKIKKEREKELQENL